MGKKGKKGKLQRNLPIFMHKTKILEKIQTNSVVIITGPTGCGKSTQVPKYLYESGYGLNGTIACLHPRCVAAMSLADRVSFELNDPLGDLVGYHVRFFRQFSEATRIMFMTTGLMLQMMKTADCVNKYTIIIIDEAHERSVQTDAMMGRMKEILHSNKFVKLVVMSATLNVDQIRNYYKDCAVVSITNTKDETAIVYRPLKSEDYISAIKTIVEEILASTKKGHILVFLQSEDKVFKCRKSLKKVSKTVILLPFFASLDYDEKMMVFHDFPGRRKLIIATNVAETSLTIPGVDFVIDSGLVKRVVYDHETGVEMWMTKPVSIAEANQRKGRTGRTGIGTCYRLYEEKCVAPLPLVELELANQIQAIDISESEAANQIQAIDIGESELANRIQSIDITDSSLIPDLESIKIADIIDIIDPPAPIEAGEATSKSKRKKNRKKASIDRFAEYPEPEIKTANLSSIIVTLKAMGKIDILKFPFIVPPDKARVAQSLADLRDLSLLLDNGQLTSLGRAVSQLPLEPRLGKVAVVAGELRCRRDVIAIIAMLAVRNVLKAPAKAQALHASYAGGHGDLFMLRNLLAEAERHRCAVGWCKANFVNASCVKYALRVASQLDHLLGPAPAHADLFNGYRRANSENLVKKVFLAGFFRNVARKTDRELYRTVDDKAVALHKYSSVDRAEPM